MKRSTLRPARAGLLLLALAAAAPPAHGQAPQPERPRARALRVEPGALRLDGRLDEAAWSAAPAAEGFVQRQPDEGRPASQATEVRFAYDAEALYVGARMHRADPGAVRAPVARRDNDQEAELLLVSLDTYLDRRTAYTFGVTAAGTRLDWYHPGDAEDDADRGFDPVWGAAVHTDSAGWTAEMRIPFSQLRFHAADAQHWGVNVRRWVPERNEASYWVMVPRSETGWSSRFGDLVDIQGVRPSRRLEVMPYVAADAAYTASPGAGNPFDDGSTLGARFGGDVKAGVGAGLTLEGTVNPDFGQVEADPASVNLTAFETIFPEKRPFFLEGSALLRGSGPTWFYSRRIGAAPVGSASGDYVDFPNTSTILGAAKLTGRLPSGASLGVLAALTDQEEARTFRADGDGFGRTRVAPRTGFLVLRGQQEVRGNGSTVGLSFTGVNRSLEDGEALANRLTRQAYAGGADWTLRFADGTYQVSGYVGASLVQGDSLALVRIQRSSARYFQRPDATHVELDSSRTSLAGYAASLTVAKRGGRHWLWSAQALARSPGFEINDAGRLSETDLVLGTATLRYRETQPGPLLRDYSLALSAENDLDFGGTRTFTSVSTTADATLLSHWTATAIAGMELRSLSTRLTRGGPLMEKGQAAFLVGSVSNPGSSRTRLRGTVEHRRGEDGLRATYVDTRVAVRPGPRWQLSVTPSYYRATDPRQYVEVLGGGPESTFGRRYVFATVERSEVAAQLRLNYAVTPDLTLEVYAEPFASSGRYRSFGELQAARGRALRLYGTGGTTATPAEDGSLTVVDGDDEFTIDNRNFDVRSFRSNAVLRWEWRPGSTLFVVWQQDRYAEQTRGVRVDPGALWDTLDTAGDNRLAFKLTYWLGVR